jgi:ribosomal protein S27E
MRVVLSLLLSILLAFAAQAEVVARSQMAGAYDQVVCAANGAQQITLDSTGHTVHRHSCTHCLAASVGAADRLAPSPALTAPVTKAQRLRPDLAAQVKLDRGSAPFARGPPFTLV